ncbi:MAG: heme exporter protein CcmD [Rhodospirillaceae bacterium]|nr:heme exporter protein CcmD [Rhodospirillaceae bacterium]|tara:strand:+ start:3946 stop:4146 length:201 start_codon:yes stop_codon:yes gene_type:complete
MKEIYNFFEMGGYALYVWSSFGFTFIIMLILLVKSYKDNRYNRKIYQDLKSNSIKPNEKNVKKPQT